MPSAIRHLHREDLIQVQRLIGQQNNMVLYPPYTYWMMSQYFSGTSLVMELSGKIVAYLAALPAQDHNILFIWQLIVCPGYRGVFRGKSMLEKIVDIARRDGYRAIQFTIRPDNAKVRNLILRMGPRHGATFRKIAADSIDDPWSQEKIPVEIYHYDLATHVPDTPPIDAVPLEG